MAGRAGAFGVTGTVPFICLYLAGEFGPAVKGTVPFILKRWFPRKKYGQRWQIETVFSMVKRNLGSALTARKRYSLNREVILKLIVHNLMILKRRLPCFQRSRTGPNCHEFRPPFFV